MSVRAPRVPTILLGAILSCRQPAPEGDHARMLGELRAGTARLARPDNTWRVDSGTVLGLSTEGATVTIAYAGDVLRRLHAEHLGETGRALETVLFDPGLRHVRRVEQEYDAPLSGRIAVTRAREWFVRGDTVWTGTGAVLHSGIAAKHWIDSVNREVNGILRAFQER